MTEEYMTTTEVLNCLGIKLLTLHKYARILGIVGVKSGRLRLYTYEQVEQIKAVADKSAYVPKLITALEKATGKKVKLI